ncbi:shikimate kinase [Lucifera butyrica]|nr:shikimate kinase [Lucifera butyrica]
MKNVVLTGFMGSGKTSTGRLLAGRMNRPFIDTDQKIEQETGMTISEIFRVYGEAYFRQKERDLINKVSRYTNTVIATGGGTVMNLDSMNRLKANGVIISLTAALPVILERTGRRTHRPVLECPDKCALVTRLFRERAELYRKADYSVDTSVYSPQEVVEQIINFLRQGGYWLGRSKG